MSIREISTQCTFADMSFHNIGQKSASGNALTFSSIHSFLSHCGMVSKMLRAEDDLLAKSNVIGHILGILPSSLIHKTTFRNSLEHYDERLKRWIAKFGAQANIGTYNIGPKSSFQASNIVLVNHYDPSSHAFTFVNKDFNLKDLHNEATRIKGIADKWVSDVESRVINPPFI